jgi:hypothetical protein
MTRTNKFTLILSEDEPALQPELRCRSAFRRQWLAQLKTSRLTDLILLKLAMLSLQKKPYLSLTVAVRSKMLVSIF